MLRNWECQRQAVLFFLRRKLPMQKICRIPQFEVNFPAAEKFSPPHPFHLRFILSLMNIPPNITQRLCRGGYQPPATLRFLSGWLNGKNVGNLYEFAGTSPVRQSGTPREAGQSFNHLSHFLIDETLLLLNYPKMHKPNMRGTLSHESNLPDRGRKPCYCRMQRRR